MHFFGRYWSTENTEFKTRYINLKCFGHAAAVDLISMLSDIKKLA